MKYKWTLVLVISLAISIAGNIYQGICLNQKNSVNKNLSKECEEMVEEISLLQEQVAESEWQLAEYANQKEKYWTLAVEDYLIFLQDGDFGENLELMYSKGEVEKCLLTFYRGSDYMEPTEIFAESFENCLGHSGFRLYNRHMLGEASYYFDVDYYAVEEELEFLAYRWGDKDDGFYELDIDGDGIKELICNVTWMADGGEDVLIFHFNGERVMRAYGSELLDEPVDNHGLGAICTTYLPDKGKIHIDYWQDELQGYAEKEYDIELDKFEWVEFFSR